MKWKRLSSFLLNKIGLQTQIDGESPTRLNEYVFSPESFTENSGFSLHVIFCKYTKLVTQKIFFCKNYDGTAI